MNKKSLKIILIAAVVLTLAIAGQLWSTRKSATVPAQAPASPSSGVDTSSWQTYRNEKYNYEIVLPPDWVKEASFTEPQEVIFSAGSGGKKYGEINVSVKEESQSFVDLWNQQVISPGSRYIGGKRAVAALTKLGDGFSSGSYSFFNGLTFYDIETKFLNATDSEKLGIADYGKILNQILSTFKFLPS